MAKEKSKGGGMPRFNMDHWEKKESQLPVADGKYASEMGAGQELQERASKLAAYAKKHKEKV